MRPKVTGFRTTVAERVEIVSSVVECAESRAFRRHALCKPGCGLASGAVHVVRPPRFREFARARHPARARARRDDGDLEPAIRVDAVPPVLPAQRRRRRGGGAGHLLAADRPANGVSARAARAVRAVRAGTAGRVGRGADRARLGAVGASLRADPAVPDLWRPLRNRDRHRLCRRRRPDGALVPGSARLRDRRRRRRLRHGRDDHDVPDRGDAGRLRRSSDADGVRHPSRRDRRHRRARPARTPPGGDAGRAIDHARPRCRTADDAEDADLQVDVRDDDDDVCGRPDGHLQLRLVRIRLRRRRTSGCGAWRRCRSR